MLVEVVVVSGMELTITDGITVTQQYRIVADLVEPVEPVEAPEVLEELVV